VYTNKIRLATAFTSVFNNYCNNVGNITYGYTFSANVVSCNTIGLGKLSFYDENTDDNKSVRKAGVVTFDEKIVSSNIETGMKIKFNDTKATIQDPKITVRRVDTAKPVVKSAAPLATTAYKKGDEAYISIIYNEPINSISGTPTLTLSSKLSPYFESPTYVNNGTGTNTLVFKVKAKKDISADEIQNVINLYLAFPVSGVGGDFSSNIGTVSATVKDILGN